MSDVENKISLLFCFILTEHEKKTILKEVQMCLDKLELKIKVIKYINKLTKNCP